MLIILGLEQSQRLELHHSLLYLGEYLLLWEVIGAGDFSGDGPYVLVPVAHQPHNSGPAIELMYGF